MFAAKFVGLLTLFTFAYGTIEVKMKLPPHLVVVEYRDMPADFGPDIPPDGIQGLLASGSPADGCNNLTGPPPVDNFTTKWIVLLAKNTSECSYEQQVRNAQAAGFDCVIVHNVNSTDLEVMTADEPDGIVIPAVFVSDDAGFKLMNYLYDSGFYIMVNSDLPFNINTHLLLPFAIVVVLCLIAILVFMIVKCIKDRRRARRHRLPSRALKQIPTCKFSKGDPYETCAICLDDYQEGERLRVLPCAHDGQQSLLYHKCLSCLVTAYHAVCIDPWLTQNKRVCPVCKRAVFAAGERRRRHASGSGSASETDDSDAPLLRDPPRTQGGTFNEQRQNPFLSARRFMERLRARAQNGEDTEASRSPPGDDEQINSNNDENSNSRQSERTPLVGARVSAERGRGRRATTARRPRRSPRRSRSATHALSVNAPASAEIGVAALPAPVPSEPPSHVYL